MVKWLFSTKQINESTSIQGFSVKYLNKAVKIGNLFEVLDFRMNPGLRGEHPVSGTRFLAPFRSQH